MNIPSGEITFLFCGIDEYSEHSVDMELITSILNAAVESNNGFMFKKTGDTFCCAFSDPADAVRAAVDAQIKLESAEWKNYVIKVRMGIHYGKSEWNGEDYMGYVTLARTHRVMSAAYGGQILISNDTYETGRNKSLGKVTFRDLGERRLKDLIQPMKLFQIISDELQSDFPPLKTLDARPNNLPVQLTNFIGREKDFAEIKGSISGNRLLTLTGPGGTGKTRLALQISADLIDDFQNGVWLTELAPISNPELVPLTIVRSLGITEQTDKETETTLLNYLKDKELLLILDNCEHLTEAAAKITSKILKNCPKVKIIATSREAMRIEGEHLYRVLPLSFPEPDKKNSPLELTQFEAVRLFIERALAVNHNFRVNNENAPALAQICRHLDGIPLAIELAAARIKIMSVEKIYEKLSDRFRLLTGGMRTALPRQQTLKAMIDWSYDLLSGKEKILFQKLSVFTGGWTLEAAEEICSDENVDSYEMLDIHSALTDKSLISTSERSGSLRFYLLESVKQYADEKACEDSSMKRRHFEYFRELSDQKKMRQKGMDQLAWVNLTNSEIDNVRTAIDWALKHDPVLVSDFIYELSDFWVIKGYMREGVQSIMNIINSELITDDLQKAKLYYLAGSFYQSIGNASESENYNEKSLAIFREKDSKLDTAKCLNISGLIEYLFKTNYTKALEFHDEAISIFREMGDKAGIAESLYLMSFPVHLNGDTKTALEYKTEALGIYQELGDTDNVSLIQASLGVFEYKRKNFESARSHSEESLEVATRYKNNYLIAINLINLGCVYKELKQFEKAKEMITESIQISGDCGYISSLLAAQMYLGEAEAGSGNHEKAIVYYKESIMTGSQSGIHFFLTNNIYEIATSYFLLNDHENSLRYFLILGRLLTGQNDPLGKANLDEIEEKKIKLKQILNDDKFEKIHEETLNLTRDEVLGIVLKEKV